MQKFYFQSLLNKIKVFLWLLLFANGIIAKGQTNSEPLSQNEFENQLSESIAASDNDQVRSLISSNRFLVKPYFLNLLSESLELDLDAKHSEAQKEIKNAELIANNFYEIFNEKSLLNILDYSKKWSMLEKEQKLKADSLNQVATSFRRDRNKDEEAVELYEKAITIYEEINDKYGQSLVLGGMGYIYYYYDAQATLSYYQKALTVRQQLDDKQLMSASLNGIGLMEYRFLNNYSKAIEYFEKAEQIRSEIKDWKNLGTTLSYKADAFERAGQLEKAVETFRQSYEVNKKAGNHQRMGEAMLNSGTILSHLGKFTEALNDLTISMEIFKEMNNSGGIGDVLTQMSSVYVNLGDYSTAISACSEALNLMKELKDDWGIAGVYNNMGVIYQSAGRLEKSTEYYIYALEKYEALQDPQSIIITLNNLGTVYYDQGDYEKAEEYHARGFVQSREINSRLFQMHCIVNMANDQNRLLKLDDAYSNYEKGLLLAESLNSPEGKWKIMVGMAENFKLRKEYDKAIEFNEKALAIIEELRSRMQSDEFKSNYMARERYVFEDVINLLGELHEMDGKQGYDLKAFELAEQSKSRALLDLLAESIANVREGTDLDLLAEQNEILTSLNLAKQDLEAESAYNDADEQFMNQLKEEIKQKENDLNTLKNKIRTTNPKYAELKYPKPVTIKQLQESCLDKNTVLLEYALGDSSSWMWVLTHEKKSLFRIANRNNLEQQVEILRFALQNPKQGSIELFIEASNKLYEYLIEPAEDFIPKKASLIIIPDGILNYLPFEVLIANASRKSNNSTYSNLPYLVLNHSINYAQSGSVLNNLISSQSNKDTNDKMKALIAFGDPVYENEIDTNFLLRKGLGRLEYSGKEVEKIAAFFPEGKAETYLREKATEENVKAENHLKHFQYIHFATHGLMDEKQPDFSSLVLTQDDNTNEDGFLQAAEIFNLQMNPELVVLSACQTGLGKLIIGEGMVGLTRAFMYAGAPSVVVSLWSVSDISTASLMNKFYYNFINKKLSKTEALQKAQLSMIKEEKYAHPYYWAPFILIGDWQ